MTAAQRDRFWSTATTLKLTVGFALALAAPYVVVVADRARVYRNAIRLGRRAA